MEKRLVITRADKDVADYTKITHPIIKKYADRCGAKFEILEDCQGLHKHYRIMQLYDKFEEYDRILVLDSDILIRNDCPNVFDETLTDSITLLLEDKGSREEDRRDRIQKANAIYGDKGWTEGYINTGFALFPKVSQPIFKMDEDTELYMDFGYDDVFLGWRIYEAGIRIIGLPPSYNFMSMFTEDWSGLQKSEAFVIHYAGMGHHPNIPKPQQIMNDYLVMERHGMI